MDITRFANNKYFTRFQFILTELYCAKLLSGQMKCAIAYTGR